MTRSELIATLALRFPQPIRPDAEMAVSQIPDPILTTRGKHLAQQFVSADR